MVDILLTTPPVTLEERYGKLAMAGNTMPSLALVSLAGILREAGFQVKIVDSSSSGLNLGQIVHIIKATSPRYVGISSSTFSISAAAQLAKAIKELDGSIKTILGGAHISSIPSETMVAYPWFDIGIIAEGEITLAEVLKSLEEGKELDDVEGLAYRKDHRIIVTRRRPFIKNLDELPFPAWDLLPGFPEAYNPPPFRFRHLPAAPLVTSRGCPNKCIFCDRSVFGNNYRFFSSSYVLQMIEELHRKYGVRELLIEDDTFPLLKERLLEICEGILRKGIKISWSCLGRVDMVEKKTLAFMKKAGCWQIGYGIESGNQEILDFERKNISLEEVERALRMTKEAGIHTKGFFILGHPNETRKTLEDTVNFAKKLALDDISVSMLTPYPGSEIYPIAERYGEFESDWEKMNLLNCVFIPHGLKREDLDHYSKKLRREFYLRPRIIWSYLKRITSDPMNVPCYFKGFMAFLNSVIR